MDPMSALIGTVLFAAGVVFLFGAYKNKRVLGADGILAQAISKGSLVSSADIPDAFDVVGKMAERADGGAAGKIAPRKRGPEALQDPINAIGVANKSLANNIGAQLEVITKDSTLSDLGPLAQLLAIADQQGFTTSTALIRAYIKELTGESI